MKRIKIKRDGIVTIAGMRGTGKTTLAKRIIAVLLQEKHTVIVYDPMQEYPNPISYIPKSDDKEDFDIFMKEIWNRGNIFVVVDEAERYMSTKQPLTKYTYKIVNTGRHRNIGLLVITRRIAELHKTVFGLSNTVILFLIYLPNDLKYISQFYDDADQLAQLDNFDYRVFSV